MPLCDPFAELLDKVANRDERAVAEFVARYAPQLRVIARTWLRPSHNPIRAVIDSDDICQSVLAWFLTGGGAARYELESPDALYRLLTVVVRNRVFAHARKLRRAPSVLAADGGSPRPADSPAEVAIANELAERLDTRLTAEEADLARRRLSGASWDDIAAAVGGTPDARRMQLARAVRKLVSPRPVEPSCPTPSHRTR